MVQLHKESKALATLAVQERKTSRYLLFDEHAQLCGRRLVKEEKTEIVRPAQKMSELAFTGIHVISPRIFPLLAEEGVFSIVPAYLRLSAQGEKLLAFRADEYYWRDLGKPENIRQAEQDMKANLVR
jgi:NDP-sugar pyrophosphorylase family protein